MTRPYTQDASQEPSQGGASFERSLSLPVSVDDLFAWHHRPGAFERLAPSWARLEVVSRDGTVEDGDRLHFRVYQGPVGIDWIARHEDFEAGRRFVDVAERSPFAAWRHVHGFEPGPRPGWATLRDAVRFRLPAHGLVWPFARRPATAALERMFLQRHLRTAIDLRRHAAVGGPPRTFEVVGAGRVADQVRGFWTTGGHLLGAQEPEIVIVVGLEGFDARAALARWVGAGGQPEVVVVVRERTEPGSRPAGEALSELRRRGIRVVELVCDRVIGVRSKARRASGASGFLDLDDLLGLIHHVALANGGPEGVVPAVVGAGLADLGFEPDFPTLAESRAHQRGRETPQMLAEALARFEALEPPR